MEFRDCDNTGYCHDAAGDYGAEAAGDLSSVPDGRVSRRSSENSKSVGDGESVGGAASRLRSGHGAGFVWQRDLEALLRCPRCQQAPLQPPVHLCAGGHSICHPCYQDLCSQAVVCANCHEEIKKDAYCLEWCDDDWCGEDCQLEPPGCVVCGAAVREGRNLLVEDLLRLLGAEPRSDALRPSPSPSAITLASVTSTLTDRITNDATRAPGCPPAASHRPIRCPRASCRSLVAVASLRSHFRSQHSDVPVATTSCGADTTLVLVPTAVPLEMATCVALLIVNRTPRDTHMARGTAALAVLTARMRLLGASCPPVTSRGADGATLLVWLCDVEGGSFTYSATAVGSAMGASFRGPVASLRSPQTPAAVLLSPGCLMLPPGLVATLTDAGALPMRLSFVVH